MADPAWHRPQWICAQMAEIEPAERFGSYVTMFSLEPCHD
jgi:hypothetical protein